MVGTANLGKGPGDRDCLGGQYREQTEDSWLLLSFGCREAQGSRGVSHKSRDNPFLISWSAWPAPSQGLSKP